MTQELKNTNKIIMSQSIVQSVLIYTIADVVRVAGDHIQIIDTSNKFFANSLVARISAFVGTTGNNNVFISYVIYPDVSITNPNNMIEILKASSSNGLFNNLLHFYAQLYNVTQLSSATSGSVTATVTTSQTIRSSTANSNDLNSSVIIVIAVCSVVGLVLMVFIIYYFIVIPRRNKNKKQKVYIIDTFVAH